MLSIQHISNLQNVSCNAIKKNRPVTKLLRLTNYQLLGLLLGVPFVAILLVSILTFLSPVLLFIGVPIILILWFGLYFGWHWTVGINLHKRLSESTMLNIHVFKFLFVFMIIYMGLSVIVPLLGNVSTIFYRVFSILNFIGSLSFLYCVGFIARILNSVEQNKLAGFKDWIGDMFLILLFPAGIYFLQPRINEIFTKEPEKHNS